MRTFFGFLFGLFAGAFLLAGALSTWQRTGSLPVPSASPDTVPDVSRTASAVSMEARGAEFLLVARLRQGDGAQNHRGDDAPWEEIFVVENGIARSIPFPASVERSVLPATDGQRVYAYVSGNQGGESNGGRRLVAFMLDGREDETVTGSTPLVEPRGLFASPDGAFLAFFLDNRQTLATELWTYDSVARAKRVSVERLTRGEIHGPYFSFDGSFLLADGRQLLGGAPRRTGVDILPVTLPRNGVRWDGNLARSPEGERVLAVTEEGDDATTITRAAEHALRGDHSVARFSRTNEVVRILGWVEPDSVLVGSGPRVVAGSSGLRSAARSTLQSAELPTVWVLRGDQQISHVLGPGARSLVVTDDGSGVGFLREEKDGASLHVLDVQTGRVRLTATLPYRSAHGTSSQTPTFRLLQHLRAARTSPEGIQAAVSPETESGRVGPAPVTLRNVSPLSPERLLQYVTDNIRVVAQAPAAEPVTAERVWRTTVPDTVYVDYRVGTTLWRRLVHLDAEEGSPVGSTVIGVFAPIGGEWVLTRGEDPTDRTPVTLYEFESDLGAWVEKPFATEEFP